MLSLSTLALKFGDVFAQAALVNDFSYVWILESRVFKDDIPGGYMPFLYDIVFVEKDT